METTPDLSSESSRIAGDPDELTSEELLWRHVVGQAIRDVYKGNDKDRRAVAEWVISKDFEIVCDYANLPAIDIREQIYRLFDLSIILCRKYGPILRSRIVRST